MSDEGDAEVCKPRQNVRGAFEPGRRLDSTCRFERQVRLSQTFVFC